MLSGRHILLGVTGGIAAYKACELLRLMIKNGASVRVAMTTAATRFVSPLTFEALSGEKVATDLFEVSESSGGHLGLVRDIDLMVTAPATADIIARFATGIADDLITTTALALTAPLLVCPAMNPKMYAHPAVQENLEKLRRRGVHIMDPDEGLMAAPGEEPGIGRLPEPEAILDRICRLLPPEGTLSGVKVTVTAGGTREAIDPVRVISNLSSGKMGYALAAEARRRGAVVRLVSGPVSLPAPPGVEVEKVDSTADMLGALQSCYDDTQVLIMAAAPGDFRPARERKRKIKKEDQGGSFSLKLVKTPDILAQLSKSKGNRLLIGFALETDDGLAHARRKLQEKNLDMIVLNHPRSAAHAGVGKDAIQPTVIFADGEVVSHPVISKSDFARILLDEVEKRLSA